MAIVALEAVEKRYEASSGPVPALRGVDLAIEAHSYVVLEGPSGAGKTTLLHLAGLLDDPTAGRVRFEGIPVESLSNARRSALRLRRIGFVFQHYYLVPDLTVEENVALPGLAAGLDAREARRRAEGLLDRVGIAKTASRLPRELSGGEQQRAGVARALVNAPALVLADEPTGNLDDASADAVAALLAEVHEEGTALLVATHDPARFASADVRVRIEAGRLTPEAPP